MPTHGPDLSRLSLSQLAELTGHDRRTVRQRLEDLAPVAQDGRTLWYEPKAALERIYLGEALDLSRERARLAAAQAERVEMENELTKGDLGTWTQLESFLVTVLSAVAQRLNALAAKVAPEVQGAASIATAQAIIDRHVREALEELADALSGKRPWRTKPKRRGNGEAAPESPEGSA